MKERTSNGEKALNASTGKRYSALVIGCGGQGALADAPGSGNESKIISYGHALKEHKGFEIAGFVDRTSLASYKAMQIWGGVATTVRYACEQIGTDVAIVATSDDQHYDTLLELIQYPLKLVICEKPICTDLDQAQEIVEAYQAKGVPLMVNYTRRFLPYHRELKRLYDLGLYGKLEHHEVLFNRGWLHTASHGIDFIRWFFNGELDGKLNILQASHEAYRIWRILLYFESHIWSESRINDAPIWEYYNFSHWYIMENAYNFLEGREPLYCTGEDALSTLEVCFRLMEGAR